MRTVYLAFQLLTRLPMPHMTDIEPNEMSKSAIWFPLVGLGLGLLLYIAAMLGLYANIWMAALLILLVWVGVTGALHLDGAADLADALGASHKDAESFPDMFLKVLKDPHIGSFGVVVIVAILLTKLVTLAWLLESQSQALWLLLLIPAWARLGTLYWSQTLASLGQGLGQQMAEQDLTMHMWFWVAGLFVISFIAVSFLFAISAMAALFLWSAFLKRRIGGMTGDCLGAGIEYVECALLLLCAGLI